MMENISVLNKAWYMSEFTDDLRSAIDKITFGRTSFSPVVANMIAEGGISFYSYLNKLGLSKEQNLMVLSSKHHYYYDESELKDIRILVNLKKLNLIKHMNAFLDTLFRLLPQDSNFVGCFSDNKNLQGPSILMNRFINILDSRTDRKLDVDKVNELLESHGFKIIDMTEIEGMTYFNARPVKKPVELRA